MRSTPFIASAAALAAYLVLGRPRVLNWGATEDEVRATLPGDDILEDVALQTTRAITVQAPASAIWPWLLQMGPRPRAGIYTYDWLERLLGIDIENSDRTMPEHQHLEVNTFWPLTPGGTNGLTVRSVIDQHAIVLQWSPARSTWAFVLTPAGDGTTRLISRNRIPGGGVGFWLGMVLAMEPGSLLMEREMLRGIRRRAESSPLTG